MSYRGAFQIGDSADLRTVFTDVGGDFMSADADPVVYFYDNSVDDDVRAAEVEAETFTSAIASVTASELSTGYYSATWTIAAEEGVVYEYWFATVDGATQTTTFTWTATAGATVSNQSPGNNTMVIIEIDGIADTDGNELEDQLFYPTVYDPLYGSPDMMRLELGKWISYIPDDTLALMLYWSSKDHRRFDRYILLGLQLLQLLGILRHHRNLQQRFSPRLILHLKNSNRQCLVIRLHLIDRQFVRSLYWHLLLGISYSLHHP